MPEDSPFYHWEVRGEYYLSLARKLLPEIETRPVIATVVCLPSFEPEWVIRIHGTEHLGFAVRLTEPTTQIYSGEQSDLNVSTNDVALSTTMAAEIRDIWCTMLRDAKYQSSTSAGTDGVSYHFLCHKFPSVNLCGYVWSPDPETRPGHLVSLAHTLREFVLTDGRAAVESQLKSEIDWFRDMPVRPPLRGNATIILQKQIKQFLEYRERGITTDTEIAAQVASAFDYVRYPCVSEMLDILELIPSQILEIIREQNEA